MHAKFQFCLSPLHIASHTFQSDYEGYGELTLDLLAGSIDAIGHRGTVHYSTKINIFTNTILHLNDNIIEI